jgi:hypothetical protein
MQIVVYVMPKSSKSLKSRKSLREIVIEDIQKGKVQFEVEYERKVGRENGWAKIKARGVNGAINLTWEPYSQTLIARGVSKGGNTPGELLGRFLGYLLEHHQTDVSSIVIRPK